MRQLEDDGQENVQKIETNRKSCQRNAKEIENLKKKMNSGDFKPAEGSGEDEEEDVEPVDTGAITKLQ